MPRYASTDLQRLLVCRPSGEMLQTAMIDKTQQQVVNGEVRLKLYKGSVMVVGRKSDDSPLQDATIATFEDDRRCLRPEGCRRLYQAERPADADRGQEGTFAALIFRRKGCQKAGRCRLFWSNTVLYKHIC
jgi:hypothetical protein